MVCRRRERKKRGKREEGGKGVWEEGKSGEMRGIGDRRERRKEGIGEGRDRGKENK